MFCLKDVLFGRLELVLGWDVVECVCAYLTFVYLLARCAQLLGFRRGGHVLFCINVAERA